MYFAVLHLPAEEVFGVTDSATSLRRHLAGSLTACSVALTVGRTYAAPEQGKFFLGRDVLRTPPLSCQGDHCMKYVSI